MALLKTRTFDSKLEPEQTHGENLEGLGSRDFSRGRRRQLLSNRIAELEGGVTKDTLDLNTQLEAKEFFQAEEEHEGGSMESSSEDDETKENDQELTKHVTDLTAHEAMMTESAGTMDSQETSGANEYALPLSDSADGLEHRVM